MKRGSVAGGLMLAGRPADAVFSRLSLGLLPEDFLGWHSAVMPERMRAGPEGERLHTWAAHTAERQRPQLRGEDV
ncbi:hypothetical protein NDU88_001211 [Pleurodeles waltl]|uniref:Uncharacterized protein n=1 Tax=Pleurodeles waltl TaxID=8319 RepID=A0AAV7VAB4_PLEWA|nr:hypothetical protein NDU88_001211 [Pleurodeles waltl]